MNKDFSVRLNNIEQYLAKALPSSAEKDWTMRSFGKLPNGVTAEHIKNLIEPNKALIELGGKRWRPLLLILCYEAVKNQHSESTLTEEQAYSITPLVEFAHTASLIQDDIEDKSDLRRGKPAAYITYGLDTALNAASWLYFEATACINELKINAEKKLELYKVYSSELRKLHLGQAMDIFWHRNPSVFPSEQEYFAMVKSKTGTLASLAAKLGCIAGGMNFEQANMYGDIASNIGIGFQIIDDVINLTTGNPGKKRGDDIVEGKKSLPIIIYSQKHADDKSKLEDFMMRASKEGIESPSIEDCIKLLETDSCIKEAASRGSKIIYDNSKLFASSSIEELFISMIPEAFR